ncbi:class I SAM-dependent methyltransferase [Paenisporosarcina cavernae]|uniref:SAM-dependent methyltransferase n=1 Tax=Paenisporosarcina cavernae TaxID=2320858 RepID=A0A385YV55_9BACL|nr:class I SAM-dependent methyltransferase [Paenisporosarcina cavernae]AYC29442.1 hypothetical protein D3873_05915 [Paenisporosarcina cavernae]
MTILTTSGRPTSQEIVTAKTFSEQLSIPYIDRNKRTLKQLFDQYNQAMLVLSKNQWDFYEDAEKDPFFFHPSSAMFRLKRIKRGENDPFIESCNLTSGMRFFDCTLGFASDALLASYVVGEKGKVVGCEEHKERAFVLKEAICHGFSPYQDFLQEIPPITIYGETAEAKLAVCEDNSFDVVYLDPMFDETIHESANMNPLRNGIIRSKISDNWIHEAKRVASKRVVMKGHFSSNDFVKYGFQQHIRPNTKFHYGVWKK